MKNLILPGFASRCLESASFPPFPPHLSGVGQPDGKASRTASQCRPTRGLGPRREQVILNASITLKHHHTTRFPTALFLAACLTAAALGSTLEDDAVPLGIYQRACLSCHGGEGQGKPGLYPPLASVDWVNAPRPDRLIRIVLQGVVGPIDVNGKPWPTPVPFMPGHARTLNDAEIAHLLTWLRRSMGNNAPPVPAAAVAAVRAATVERKSMWTAAELLGIPDR